MSESKEPGQRAYEVYVAHSPGAGFTDWERLDYDHRRAWASVERATPPESAPTLEPAAADPQLWAELNSLVELVGNSAPLAWAASGDMAGAGDWEREAEKVLARVVALQSKTLPAEPAAADRAAWAVRVLDLYAEQFQAETPSPMPLPWDDDFGKQGEGFRLFADGRWFVGATRDAARIAAAEALASASPDRYPDRPAEVAAPPGEQWKRDLANILDRLDHAETLHADTMRFQATYATEDLGAHLAMYREELRAALGIPAPPKGAP